MRCSSSSGRSGIDRIAATAAARASPSRAAAAPASAAAPGAAPGPAPASIAAATVAIWWSEPAAWKGIVAATSTVRVPWVGLPPNGEGPALPPPPPPPAPSKSTLALVLPRNGVAAPVPLGRREGAKGAPGAPKLPEGPRGETLPGTCTAGGRRGEGGVPFGMCRS
jgi:hypothetical protein